MMPIPLSTHLEAPDAEDRRLSYGEAINEAMAIALEVFPTAYVIGLGAPDPAGIFGTTLGLTETFGKERVLDMPISENAVTGVVLGSAIDGMRPILTHQRLDFALDSIEQIVNQAAKWHYMFGGRMTAPLVIRMVVGRGWGQGPQHSQSLQSWFAHVPGLKVVMPALPADAKGLLLSAVADPNPVIVIEHRWLHNIEGPVPEGDYRSPLGEPRIIVEGTDATITATSYMTVEALRAAELLQLEGISTEVIDVRTLNPLDDSLILESVRKTGRLVVADTGWTSCGFAGEIVARVSEKAFDALKSAPRRVASPDAPTPTSQKLTDGYYPRAIDIAQAIGGVLGRLLPDLTDSMRQETPLDVPDTLFRGPF
jgi:pyruvate dehydrogenase E1 component beta subunit